MKSKHDVVAGGHAHHADDGEQHQSVELAVVLVLNFQIVHRHQHRDRRARQEEIEEIEGEGIDQQCPHEAGVDKAQAFVLREVIGPMQLADGRSRECKANERDDKR